MSKEVQEVQDEATQQPQLFITTDEILNGVLQYLGSRPYAEVAHLIDGLRQSKPVSPQPIDDGAKETPVKEMEVIGDETVAAE